MKVYTITCIENIAPPQKPKPGTSKLNKENSIKKIPSGTPISSIKKISSKKRNFKFPKKLLKLLL